MKMGNLIMKATTVTFVMVSILMMNACKKDSHTTSGTDNTNASTLSANGATSDNAYDDAFNIALQSGSASNLNNIMLRQGRTTTLSNGTTTNGINGYYCATITNISGTSFPVTFTVDFGSGCTSQDNVTRSGSITYTFSGKLSTPGTVISATFNNYVVNGYKLGGTYSITNSSTGLALSLTTAVSDGSIVYPNDSSYTFSGSKTVAFVSGDTSDISTFVFHVTGGYSISNSSGATLAATITTPLIRKLSCPFIVSGITTFAYTSPALSVNGTLNYGTGDCDDNAVVTIGTFTKTIILW
jgi:hypothetical protein